MRGFIRSQSRFQPFILHPQRDHIFRPSQWTARLGDVRHEISSDKQAGALKIHIASLPPAIASNFAQRINACLKARDEVLAAIDKPSEPWSGMGPTIEAEEQAKKCLSEIGAEINRALMTIVLPDAAQKADVPMETYVPVPVSNIVAPVAVGTADIAAVFLLS